MTRKLVAPFLMTLALLAICIPIFAHHGTAGVYDFTQRITTKATVTQYVWANPHVQIYFRLKNDKGEEETWGVETVSPGNALANGWISFAQNGIFRGARTCCGGAVIP